MRRFFLILLCTVLLAVVIFYFYSAPVGYVLSLSGDYDKDVLTSHKFSGIILAVIAGILYFITTGNNPLTDQVSSNLLNLKHLESVNLNRTKITDATVVALKRNTAFKNIYTWDTSVVQAN